MKCNNQLPHACASRQKFTASGKEHSIIKDYYGKNETMKERKTKPPLVHTVPISLTQSKQ